jgi:LysM repeat protein
MARKVGAPNEKLLPFRLTSLLDSLFEVYADPYALYRGIVTQLRPVQLAAVQKRIKKRLQQKGEISTEAAMLVACVLYRTGFPPQRILHFLSLYVRGTVTLSLFELTVGAIFGDTPPLSSSLLYDITQYTYLEKRLLARKSLEISDGLKDSLSPATLLYLYLLSLRDDLSNENAQLVALIMKNCFPALGVRTRLGGASLEEYGEIARAWRRAEQRSLAAERARRAGAERRSAGTFDRDSASFFLDKYFSDAALEKMRASAPSTAVPIPRPRAEMKAAPLARRSAAPEPPAEPSRPNAAEAFKSKAAREGKGGLPAAHGTRGAPEPLAARSALPQREQRPDMSRRTADVSARGTRPSAARRPQSAAPQRPQGPHGMNDARRERVRALLVPRIPVIAATVILAAVFLGLRVFAWQAPSAAIPQKTPGPAATSGQQVPAAAVITTTARAAAPSIGPGMTAATSKAPAVTAMTAAPTAAPTVTYVVQEGDSLWRIFAALRMGSPHQKDWTDFLSNTLKLNNLQDPDRIHAGSRLTLTGQNK